MRRIRQLSVAQVAWASCPCRMAGHKPAVKTRGIQEGSG
jgi:hypothetical protein